MWGTKGWRTIWIAFFYLFASCFLFAGDELNKKTEFILRFANAQELDPYIDALESVSQFRRNPGERADAMGFFRKLLASSRHRKLHPYVWLNLSRFYTGGSKESMLMRALDRCQTITAKIHVYQALAKHFAGKNVPAFQRAYLDRLIGLYESGLRFKQAAWAFCESGNLLLRRMAAHAAVDHFLRSLEIEEKGPTAGESCLGAAIAMGMLNKPGLAEKYLKRALDNAQKYRLQFLKIKALSLYAQILLEHNRLEMALKYVRMSLEIERKVRKYVCARDSLFRKALIEEKLGAGSKAIASLKKAVKTGIHARDLSGMFPVIAILADRLLEKGEIRQCQGSLVQLDDLFAPYHPHYFLYYYLRGRVSELQGDTDRAEILYNRALDSLRKQLPRFSFSSRSFWKEWLNSLYNHVILFRLNRFHLSSRKAFLVEAIRLHEQKSRLITNCIVRRGSFDLSLIRVEKRMQAQYNRYLSERMKLDNESPTAGPGLTRLVNQYREIQELLSESKQVPSARLMNRFNLAGFQSHIPENRMVLKFMLLKEQVAAVCIDGDNVRLTFLPAKRKRIVDHLNRLVSPLDDFSQGRVDYLRIHYDLPVAGALHDMLIKPVEKNFSEKRELVLIPDGDLFRLPFDALVSGFNRAGYSSSVIFSEYTAADYLIQRYRISLAPSLENLGRSYRFNEKIPIEVAAFGGPVFRGGDGPAGSREALFLKGMRSLPNSIKEVRQVRNLFPRGACSLFIGESFTITNFRRFAPRARIIHVATHYMPNTQSPWNSGLIFSKDPLDPSESRLLRANEVQHIPLQAELMVLSACESSDRKILGLKGMAGMLAALSENGIRNALVSLWPVDEYSAKVLPTFYRHYRNQNDASKALRRAKMEMMQSEVMIEGVGRVSLAHPFLWGNFQVFRFRR